MVGLVLGEVYYSAAVNLVQIQNVGTIRAIGVEVYSEDSLSETLEQIAWGTLDLGETRPVDVWIKNTGNDAQKLVMWTEKLGSYGSSEFEQFFLEL